MSPPWWRSGPAPPTRTRPPTGWPRCWPTTARPPRTAPAPPADGQVRPPALSAACVHTPSYGTRSALIVTVPAAGPPRLRVADGPPCQVPFEDVTSLWSGAGLDRDPARR